MGIIFKKRNRAAIILFLKMSARASHTGWKGVCNKIDKGSLKAFCGLGVINIGLSFGI